MYAVAGLKRPWLRHLAAAWRVQAATTTGLVIFTRQNKDICGSTMAKTDKLYVNLSASQVRKRLKGHGLGVKKVESADRNQAVIIHTATGQHLRELKSLLADVIASSSPGDLGIPVENLRNLGATNAEWLRDIGVHTRQDLEEMGPAVAFRLVKQQRPNASLNLLWAMAAALVDQDWRELSAQAKEQLRHEAEED